MQQAMKEQHEQDHEDMLKVINDLNDTLKPIAKFFDNMTFSKSAMMWVLGFVGAFIGVIIGILQIIKMFK